MWSLATEGMLDLKTDPQREDGCPKENGDPKKAPEERAGYECVGVGQGQHSAQQTHCSSCLLPLFTIMWIQKAVRL